jgi:hypothetical protein
MTEKNGISNDEGWVGTEDGRQKTEDSVSYRLCCEK